MRAIAAGQQQAWRAGVVVLAVALATAVSCSSGATRGGQFVPPGLHNLHGCAGAPGFTCGDLTVPLDPAGAAPGRLTLQVGLSAAASAPRGVLVFLTGGPGEPGVPFCPRIAARLGSALAGYRLVMFDRRGTGPGALKCPELQQVMGASDLTVPSAAAVRRCAAAIGPRRRFFATADTVADIEALRRALGVPKVTVDGVSYGTYVAEQFALAHPAEVTRLVLDSVVPNANVDPLQLVNMRDSARVLRAVCAAQRCGFDPAADVATVVRRYRDGPALLDTLVALSVGDPTFTGVLPALHAAAAGAAGRSPAAHPPGTRGRRRDGGRAEPGTARQHAVRGPDDAVGRPADSGGRPRARPGPRRRPAHPRPDLAVRPGHRGRQRLHPDVPVLAARTAGRAPGPGRDQAPARSHPDPGGRT